MIDDQLNVVFPVVTEHIVTKFKNDEGEGQEKHEDVVRVHAYHTPISRAVFEANFRLLASTKSSLASKGSYYLMSSGPRIAALTLRDEGMRDAESRGRFDDAGNPKNDEAIAFLAELKRLTTILCAGANGWEMIPVDAAITQGKIDSEDWEEVLASIVFFTCHASMAKKADRKRTSQATASLLNALTTSLPLSEYHGSLQNSTKAETSPPKVVSSVPS